MRSLFDCYKKPSARKQAIYASCVQEAIEHNAMEYGIRSYNVNVFTFYYIYTNENGEKIKHIIYPTRTEDILI